MQLSRSAALAYRASVHDITRPAASVTACAVLDIGVQDTPPGTTAGRALAARLPSGAPVDLPGSLALVHSMRGTMHLHRVADLGLLATALRPDDAADLLRQTYGTFFLDAAAAGVPVGEAFDEVADKMAGVMANGEPRSKGELSSALNEVVDKRLRPWCAGCGVAHVHDGLFRLASLPAGLRLLPAGDGSADFVAGPPPVTAGGAGLAGARETAASAKAGRSGSEAAGRTPGRSGATEGGSPGRAGERGGGPRAAGADAADAAGRTPGRSGATEGGSPGADAPAGRGRRDNASDAGGSTSAGDGMPPGVAAARGELVRRYLRFCGPTDRGGLAAWLGLAPVAARRWWALVEDDLEPVEVEGRRLYMHGDDLAEARQAGRPSGVRLLPPFDPMLELADRELLVPAAADRKVLWRAAANPGAVVATGEVVGAWRRRKGVVTVTPFGSLSAARRKEIVKEAQTEVVFD